MMPIEQCIDLRQVFIDFANFRGGEMTESLTRQAKCLVAFRPDSEFEFL